MYDCGAFSTFVSKNTQTFKDDRIKRDEVDTAWGKELCNINKWAGLLIQDKFFLPKLNSLSESINLKMS